MNQRALIAATVVGLLGMFAEGLKGLDGTVAQDDVAPFAGSLLHLSQGDVWELDLSTEARRLVIDAGAPQITHVAHSPDRRRLAYSVLARSGQYQITRSEIVVSAADGTLPAVVVREERPNLAVGWPAWGGDGSRLLYTLANVLEASERVEEVEIASGARTLVVEEGWSPSASPNGQHLSYALRSGRRWGIWGLDRPSGARQQLVAAGWFDDVDVPAFSPDGSTIAFVAAGPGPSPLLGGMGLGVAHAHDVPGAVFDLWTVGADGSGLRRVAELFNEQPYEAWSPDGRHVAAWGRLGLQIVDVSNGAVQWVSGVPNAAPISWGH